MKYNIYYMNQLVKKNVDGETVRKFMLRLTRDETQYVKLERIREEDEEER